MGCHGKMPLASILPSADVLAFAVISATVLGGAALVLRRTRRGAPFGPTPWVLLAVVVVAADLLAERAADAESDRLRFMVRGFAPTYALAMKRLGHPSLPDKV